MGRRNRRRKQNTRSRFHANSNLKAYDGDVNQERYNHAQEQHLKRIVEQKKDILSRTIFVGSVLGSLHDKEKKETLKKVLEVKYGPVQKVAIRKGGGKHPMGLVTFNFQHDAVRIFGSTLMEAVKARKQVKVACGIGYKGAITVRPATDYNATVNEEDASSTIQVNTKGIMLGYWFPRGRDECINFPGLEHLAHDSLSTWLCDRKTNVSSLSPIMNIDIQRAVVELDITHCMKKNPTYMFSELTTNVISEIFSEGRTLISFRFKDFRHPIMLAQNNGSYFLHFELRHHPRVSTVTVNPQTGFESNERLTFLTEIPSLGSYLGYQLEVEKVEIDRLISAQVFEKLKKMGLYDDELHVIEHAEDVHISHVPNSKFDMNTYIASFPSQRLGLLIRSVLDANSCTWFDILNDKTRNGHDILCLVRDSDRNFAERILNEMREMHGKTRYPAQMYSALYEAHQDEDEVALTVPEYCISLPRLLITPLAVKVTCFDTEMSNRFVRKFIEKQYFSNEAFIRVSIGDENMDNMYSNDLSQQVEERIKDLVLNGITIGMKNYKFLAYSSSQLKEQSLWMVCPEKGWDVNKMRSSMGDFSMCKTPSKYGARIGQCFSTTMDTSTASVAGGLVSSIKSVFGFGPSTPRVYDALPDIFSNSGQEHSDGVGLISRDHLNAVLLQLPFSVNKDDVSAIQIRFGGAKGVLVAWDFTKLNHGKLNGYDVFLRPSQVKFKAPYDNLEVVTIAKRIPYYLNRNVILLGQHHSISDQIFLDLQTRHIDNLNKMLRDASFAISFIPQLSGPDNALVNALHSMLCAGVEPQIDPFLYSCLHCFRSHHLMNLRKKTRILVEKGAVLIGGIDELGILPEGCCFLQVPKPKSSKNEYEVITGKIQVTKHPVMHPGDMRMFEAIDVPELRGHKNILLFSQLSDRPEADKMSGSDLDGDQFACTWDKRLFINTTEPMDYLPATKTTETCVINDESLLQHFINHARNDNLGRISMLWIDHATIKKDAGCPECLQLAKLASIAVDFPKSGVPAVLPHELVLNSNVPRAHWRELRGKPSFHCQSAVGKLYDEVINEMNSKRNAPQPNCIAMAGRFRDNNGQILYLGDRAQLYEKKMRIFSIKFANQLGWKGDEFDEMLLEFADHQRNLYDSQLLELMNQYKIKSEGEVTTGCILKYHKLHKRRRHDISEEVRRQFRNIRKLFRSEFFTAIYHLSHGNNRAFFSDDSDDVYDDISDENLELIEATVAEVSSHQVPCIDGELGYKVKEVSSRLAAAYYVVTYSPSHHDQDSKSVLYSFPWVLSADVMARSIYEDQSKPT